MHVPLLDLKAQYLAIKAEVDAAIAEVMTSQHFILGPNVEACERAIAPDVRSIFDTGGRLAQQHHSRCKERLLSFHWVAARDQDRHRLDAPQIAGGL